MSEFFIPRQRDDVTFNRAGRAIKKSAQVCVCLAVNKKICVRLCGSVANLKNRLKSYIEKLGGIETTYLPHLFLRQSGSLHLLKIFCRRQEGKITAE